MDLEEFLKKEAKKEVTDFKYPIRKIKAYETYVMVFLDDEKIQVSDDDYFTYGLKDLKGLDGSLYETLKEHEILLKAYRGCLRKISSRDQTVKQIDDYLYQKGIKRPQRKPIIDKLISYGLLDDEKYCISHISYLQNSSLSVKQIREKLKKAGISDELIEKHLKSDYESESNKALSLAKKYERSIRNKSVNQKKQNILNKLVSAGFSYEMSLKAIESLVLDDGNELELLRKEYLKALKKYEKKYEGYDLKQHITSYLMGKGFGYDDIRKITEEENG